MLKPMSAIAALIATAIVVIPTVTGGLETVSLSAPSADLNLASAAAGLPLKSRLAAAARVACDVGDSRGVAAAAAAGACRTQAVARALGL